MVTLKKIIKLLCDKDYRFLVLSGRGYYKRLSDEEFIKRLWKIKMGNEINLSHPRTFNEKLQWLKLNDRKSIYTTMVDKIEAKRYVASIIGEEHIIPTIGIWENVESINFQLLPSQFVLKCSHDSGGIVICRDKDLFNERKTKRILKKSLKRQYFYTSREYPYKNVQPRILAEKYMQEGKIENLIVYKVFNFMGNPELIQVIQNDKTEYESIDYYNIKWEHLKLHQNYPNSKVQIEKPQSLDKILELAKMLSKDISFVRTDFYQVSEKVYFSEFTFYSDAGFERFYPDEWDKKLGDLLILPNQKK